MDPRIEMLEPKRLNHEHSSEDKNSLTFNLNIQLLPCRTISGSILGTEWQKLCN